MDFDASTFLRSSSRSLPGGEYDVLMSFRGVDTRKTFTDFLYTSLVDAGVRTFQDDNELRIGEEIGPELVTVIKESNISIPILSKNYASSKWCLSELAKMVECRRTTGRPILPIFYDVDPSEVRHQSGSYEKAFRHHESRFSDSTVKEWKEALREVGALKGWQLNTEFDGNEEELIKIVVQGVLSELKKNYMFDTSTSLRSSSRSLPGGEYDVFLSFRASDTRNTFTDYLYASLIDVGVRTFRDNDELRIGEETGPELLKAIKESKISIPILSKNYASSKWCLYELAKMVECRRTTGRVILPIFYDVDPSEVRHQSGSYKKAFRQHESQFSDSTVKEWKEALREVGAIRGWDVKKQADGHEGKLIKMIVQTVLLELKRNYMFLTDKLIGIDHHENEMMTLLNVSSNDVQFVGIRGIGGIGKTTIAKVIYNKLFENFECCSFLENVRESAQQRNGLVSLQKQLLAETLNWRPDIADVNSGINVIKHRFLRKKVLLILDDVTERSQLDCLVGNRSWFGPGSRIIVTTRDKHVLQALEVNGIYEPPFMDSEQALQLFSMHAFRSKFPPEEYDSISRDIVSTAAGLPLALEVIGSFLSDKDEISWKETLTKLKKLPDDQVSKKWMISYQELNDAQKQIFLDIACLFTGMDKTYAFYMWNDCGYDTETEINVLCLMSLVKIGDDNVLWMQNQLRDLGTEIVRQENFINPGKRSRLWDHEEALVILEQQGGTEMVETLSIDFELGSHPCFTNKEFVKLIKLRYLQMYGAELVGDFKHLLPNLRWLNWRGCPSIFKPANFHLKNLVILDLSYSDVTEDWGGWSQIKMAKNLKVLKLAYCSIRRTPDLSKYALLEILILRGCACLIEIGRSIGNLKKLKVLDISETHVKKLPDEVWMLEKLEINATDCFYLKRDIPSCIGGQSSKRFLSSVASKPRCLIFILFFIIVGARLHRASTAAR